MKVIQFDPRVGAAIFLTGSMLVFGSCNRERIQFDGETTTTIDNSLAEGEFASIRNLIDTEARADSNVYGKTEGTTLFCPGSVVTVTLLSASSAEMEVDFGTGVNCFDGRLRTGKLSATFTGKWKDAGSSVVIVPTDYTVSGYAVSFNKTITFNGNNGQGQPNWHTVVSNATFSNAQGTFTWNCDRVTTWAEGAGDLDPNNDAFEITGEANGTARNGLTYTAVVDASHPLRSESGCSHLVSGVFSITPQGYSTREIDYGAGTCDDQATLTVGSYTTQITLR